MRVLFAQTSEASTPDTACAAADAHFTSEIMLYTAESVILGSPRSPAPTSLPGKLTYICNGVLRLAIASVASTKSAYDESVKQETGRVINRDKSLAALIA